MSAQLEIRQYAGGDRHRHDYCQFLVPLKGSMRIDIEGRSGVVSSHCLAVIPQESVHDFMPSADCNMFVLDVEAATLAQGALPTVLKGEGPIVTRLEPWLWRLFRQLGAEVEADARRADDVARLALTSLQLVKPTSAPPADKRILAVAQGQEETGVAEMARAAGLGQSQFHALFRATTGQSPKQYRLSKLLDRAVDRLVTTADPIAEIAYGLGYQNVSSFNRLFRQRFGVTPSEFRTGRRSLS
ncbi:helix-turn-helix domain-containing protein [Taklimakanibacter deserti]|uniref:helix-turn-helix domain-containing protein n=1 Tax=Taklimakanibacter deserti TaxID=2267839 RepID=UPI000E647E6F